MGYTEIYEKFLQNNIKGYKYHIKLKDNTELIGIPTTAGSFCTDPAKVRFSIKKDNGEIVFIPFESILKTKQIN
ncbi:MAG: hypothetical protein NG784_05865 [Candidatus Jettenia sp.]|nr:hypothetical protein [Candidatus Jettenia sp.]